MKLSKKAAERKTVLEQMKKNSIVLEAAQEIITDAAYDWECRNAMMWMQAMISAGLSINTVNKVWLKFYPAIRERYGDMRGADVADRDLYDRLTALGVKNLQLPEHEI